VIAFGTASAANADAAVIRLGSEDDLEFVSAAKTDCYTHAGQDACPSTNCKFAGVS